MLTSKGMVIAECDLILNRFKSMEESIRTSDNVLGEVIDKGYEYIQTGVLIANTGLIELRRLLGTMTRDEAHTEIKRRIEWLTNDMMATPPYRSFNRDLVYATRLEANQTYKWEAQSLYRKLMSTIKDTGFEWEAKYYVSTGMTTERLADELADDPRILNVEAYGEEDGIDAAIVTVRCEEDVVSLAADFQGIYASDEESFLSLFTEGGK